MHRQYNGGVWKGGKEKGCQGPIGGSAGKKFIFGSRDTYLRALSGLHLSVFFCTVIRPGPDLQSARLLFYRNSSAFDLNVRVGLTL